MGAKVEHPFLYVKHHFGYAKVRYRGPAKHTRRIALLPGFSNPRIAGRYATAWRRFRAPENRPERPVDGKSVVILPAPASMARRVSPTTGTLFKAVSLCMVCLAILGTAPWKVPVRQATCDHGGSIALDGCLS